MKKPILQRIPEHFRQKRELRAWAEPIAARTGLSADWIMADCKKFWDDHAVRREEYEELSLCTQPAALRDNFLGQNEQRVYLDYLNPIKYYSLARNKYLAHKVMENTGIRKTELYCYYLPEGKVIEIRKYDTVHGPWFYFTVDDGNVEGFARKLDVLMGDDTLRATVSKNAIESMVRFEPSIIITASSSLPLWERDYIKCIPSS